MSLAAGATLLGAVGHLANLGQFVEIGQGHAYQREQMAWARRAYCLDSRALRIDLLNAVKEDVRDHHQTYAGRIDTLLLVHTLLLTFALATLQYSDQFVPSSDCTDCVESLHPSLVIGWVYAVSAILILPFWSMVMLIWSKLQLDRWLESSLGRLNLELRGSLAAVAVPALDAGASASSNGASSASDSERPLGKFKQEDEDMLARVEMAVTRLSGFVVDHQESFKRIWGRECRTMIYFATVFLWVSCVLAIGITAGMFWLFLQNHMEGKHKTASTHFAVCTLCGLLAPAIYYVALGGPLRRVREDCPSDEFEDCIDAHEHDVEGGEAVEGSGETERQEGTGGFLRSTVAVVAAGMGATAAPVGRGLLQVIRLPLKLVRRDPDVQLARDRGGSARDPFASGWARMDDEGGITLTDRLRDPPAPATPADGGFHDPLPPPGGFLGGGGGRFMELAAESPDSALLGSDGSDRAGASVVLGGGGGSRRSGRASRLAGIVGGSRHRQHESGADGETTAGP